MLAQLDMQVPPGLPDGMTGITADSRQVRPGMVYAALPGTHFDGRDFIGDAVARGLAMTRNGGTYYIVGYGGKIELPTIDMVTSEKTIVGNLVGTYPELVELMALDDPSIAPMG